MHSFTILMILTPVPVSVSVSVSVSASQYGEAICAHDPITTNHSKKKIVTIYY